MALKHYSTTKATALSASMTSGDTAVYVADGSSFPDPDAPGNGDYTVIIGYGSSREEVCTVTAKPGANLLTVTRAQDGTTATAKNIGDVVVHGVSARDFDGYLSADGGTMTGELILSGSPTDNLGATTKAYVDAADATKMPKAGGTFTGAVVLAGAPTAGLHPATKTYVDESIPIGGIIFWFTNTAPTGWHMCDGTAHGSAALQAVIGSANAPDFRDLFPVGAGGMYTIDETGGADSVTLTAAQSGLPQHTHTATVGNQSASHTHAVDPPSTTSSSAAPSITVLGPAGIATGEETGDPLGGSGVQYLTDATGDGAGGNPITATQAGHTHTVNVASFDSGTQSASHNHTVTNANAGPTAAAQAHENRPRFRGVRFIIKKA